jgi:uncharacterized protein YcfJ
MLKNLIGAAAIAALTLGGATSAMADRCSGHDHLAGTIIGGVAGGALGSAVTHGNAGGVIGGAVLGGMAGNNISRNIDCHRHRAYYSRHHRHYASYYTDRYGRRHYYDASYRP